MTTDFNDKKLKIGDQVIYAWRHKGQFKEVNLLFNGTISKLLPNDQVLITDVQSVRSIVCEGFGVLKVDLTKPDQGLW